MAPLMVDEDPSWLGKPSAETTQARPSAHKQSEKEDRLEPIAIVGYAYRFPGEAVTDDGFWRMMMEKRCVASEAPADRINSAGWCHPDKRRIGQYSARGGHFLQEDVSRFDAAFFSISADEAAAMDPQQRHLLEVTYAALENAGVPMERVAGSQTSVHVGCFGSDYRLMMCKDIETSADYDVVGINMCMHANRISWFFDCRGASMNIDTACSSSLVALDLACQGLRSGEAEMGIVSGTNLLLSPDMMQLESNVNMLSPDSRSHSFDHRANGYGRGEGTGTIIVKRLRDALRDGDTIRAIIRSTASNTDGLTPSGIMQPSGAAQAALIRRTYQKAGLSLEPTRFFEAHGTGTPVGDPIECNAIGEVFRSVRGPRDPLIIGALKSNIGHLEGASGIAAVIKTILVLERAVIPPNANFEKVNPRIDLDFLRLKLPLKARPWPTQGLRRASVNSFGFGGANAHVVLDDALHYLRGHGLVGHHVTREFPPPASLIALGNTVPVPVPSPGASAPVLKIPKLLTMSAASKDGMKTMARAYATHFQSHPVCPPDNLPDYMDRLAYTLNSRRSALGHKSFCIASSYEDLCDETKIAAAVYQAHEAPVVGLVFTGQGAQWAGMGRGLMVYPVFRRVIEQCEEVLLSLGCLWSLRTEMFNENNTNSNGGGGDASRIHEPEIAQPANTALQMALVDLLRGVGLKPAAVIGHSSGEIAAAYALGALSLQDAMRIAYYRGVCASALANDKDLNQRAPRGAMLAVGLSADQTERYLDRIANTSESNRRGIAVACVNSHKSVTVSGDADQISQLQAMLESENVFARKLRIPVAYHSFHMNEVAEPYRRHMQGIRPVPRLESFESSISSSSSQAPIMVSSVTGQRVQPADVVTADYWVANLVSPVLFPKALFGICTHASGRKGRKVLDCSHRGQAGVNILLEVGPHSALQGPIRDLLGSLPWGRDVHYCPTLQRKDLTALHGFLTAVGQLHSLGVPIDLERVNRMGDLPVPKKHDQERRPRLLVDLPPYPFNHSTVYWRESRLSRRSRLGPGRIDLLGKPVSDWNPLEARWRHHIRLNEMPWVEDHMINGTLIYPAAGMVVMAIEAASQMVDPKRRGSVVGFDLQNVEFQRALTIPQTAEGVETNLLLRTLTDKGQPLPWMEFRLCSRDDRDEWHEHCRGEIHIEYETADTALAQEAMVEHWQERRRQLEQDCATSATAVFSIEPSSLYNRLRQSGFEFGPTFQTVTGARCNGKGQATASINVFQWPSSQYPQAHVIHPTTLDGIFHLSTVALIENKDSTASMATAIPTSIRSLWVAAQGSSSPDAATVRAATWIKTQHSRGHEFDTAVTDQQESRLLVRLQGLRSTIVAGAASQNHSTAPASGEETAALTAYRLRLVPDLDTMGRTQVVQYCRQNQDFSLAPWQVYIQTLARKNPMLRILEIGVGSGEWTQEILHALSVDVTENAEPDNAMLYASYDCTDSSSVGFEKVAHGLGDVPRLGFLTLDIETDPTEQGFALESYDLIVLGDAVQVNDDRANSIMRHVYKLLRPGGHLILKESPCPQGTEQGESLRAENSPAQRLGGWGSSSREMGFQDLQLDLSIRYRGGPCEEPQWIVVLVRNICSSPVASGPSTPAPQFYFIVDPNSAKQQITCSRTGDALRLRYPESTVQSGSLEECASLSGLAQRTMVFLVETEQPLLGSMTPDTFRFIQKVVHECNSILWVTAGGGPVAQDAHYGIVDGWARTLRNEKAARRICTLALETIPDDSALLQPRQIAHLVRVCTNALFAPTETAVYEPEFVEVEGTLHVRRVETERPLTTALYQASQPRQSTTTSLQELGSVALAIGTPGLLTSLHWTDDSVEDDGLHAASLRPDEALIETKAIGVSLHDVLIAAGKLPDQSLGLELAGIVVQAGSSCEYRPGERVLAFGPGSFRNRTKVKTNTTCAIPENMSFTEAAALPLAFGTAWHVLVELARLQRGQSVLIHLRAGAAGQALIRLAKHLGAVIFTTTNSQQERALLVEQYGLSDEQIFYSRDPYLSDGLMRVTRGRGVDVVLNDLEGDVQRVSWECLALYGRLIQIDHGPTNTTQPATLLPGFDRRQASLTLFDSARWLRDCPEMVQAAVRQILNLIQDGHLSLRGFYQAAAADSIQQVFQSVQEEETTGKTVIDLTLPSQVPAVLKTRNPFRLRNDATYVIAGGLGGLGRATARWMAANGARSLVLLGRSGANSPAARNLVEELASQGVQVYAPPCDVTDITALQTVLDKISRTMPPVRGCIQGSMVLRDRLFSEMTYEEWCASLNCKVLGSRNLAASLPPAMDFFILLSSVSSVVGLTGQANYAAGNSYMDSLARLQASQHGQRAISLNLGPMGDDGVLAENTGFLDQVLGYGSFTAVTRDQLFALLAHCCDPDQPQAQSPEQAQVVYGISAKGAGRYGENPVLEQPLFRRLKLENTVLTQGSSCRETGGGLVPFREQFIQSTSLQEGREIVGRALADRMIHSYRLIPEDAEIDADAPLHVYRVDSLLAVELCNWIGKEFQADIAVLEVLGGASFAMLSMLVASRSQLAHPEWS
ncbi:polyketide synthase [Aspergillus homomorphus CBS 101889]|uniref:Polyketide synthase n=1 Tax=Aspergillus homomorphus (strain CBS 101889) TaxID=1450537 RepID=A0A395HKN8_ASPHC|nr:polyketide synthase [Aspergillus homomorphus CBS 101889]RAL08511.1 polyketide synthase [Aspergillus homomorphus CBS 101889]